MRAPVVGAKVTVKVVLAPAAKVSGNVGPVTLKPNPLTVVWVMFTLPVPVLVRVTVCVLVVPTLTLPKLSLLELELRR